ncbi:MAG: FAD-binding protein [Dehalogenimonas sp.]
MPKYDYDLIVIGCGVSGFTAATLAAGLGKRVLVVEKEASARDATLQAGLPSKA